MSDVQNILEKFIGWVLPIAVGVIIFVFKDKIARAGTEVSLKSENVLTSTLLTNAIKQIEEMKVTVEGLRNNLNEVKTQMAVNATKVIDEKAYTTCSRRCGKNRNR